MSAGFCSPGILTGMKIPCAFACLTKCTLLSMCLVYFDSFSLFIIAIALVESTKVRKVSAESGCFPSRLLKICFKWMVAVIANAAALYSASALDKATGTGTKDAPSTKLPWTYAMYAPVF